jgi:short-subunit dehydrogenase
VTGPARTALVTGASSGIGAATARRLADRGTTVVLVARRADRLEGVLADCIGPAPGSRAWPADLSDPEQAAEVARAIDAELGPVDVVVNNAGAPMRRPVQRLTMDEVRRTMAINYLSPVAISLALLPGMLERKTGVIVNVSSLGGRLGIASEAAYCGSKFALAGWSESMAADLHGTGVSVRLVLPGAIDTEIWDQPDNDPPLYVGPLVPADEVAAGIVDCLDSPAFEHYLPDMKAVVEMKTSDFDSFVAGMIAMAKGRVEAEVISRATDPASPSPR